jgi:hypothetical protein
MIGDRASNAAPVRLVLWAEAPDAWQFSIEGSDEARSVTAGEQLLPPGRYTIFARPSSTQFADWESLTLDLASSRVYLYVAGARPVALSIGGEVFDLAATRSEPLVVGQAAPEQDMHAPDLPERAFIAVDAPIRVQPCDRPIDVQGADLLVVNPYDVPVVCEVGRGTAVWRFRLSAGGARWIAGSRPEAVQIRATFVGQLHAIAPCEVSLPAAPSLAIHTLGSATLLGFARGEQIVRSLPPGLVQQLEPDLCRAIRLPTAGSGGEPHTADAILQCGDERLFVLASAPLLPPQISPLSAITSHPNVTVSRLPLPESLADRVVVDVAGYHDQVLGVCGGNVFDLASGAALHGSAPQGPAGPVRKVACGPGGAFVLLRGARLARIESNELRLDQRELLDPTFDLWISTQTGDSLLHGGKASSGLHRLDGDGLIRLERDVQPRAITALADAPEGIYLARGRQIDRGGYTFGFVSASPVISLPPGPPVIGLLAVGDALLFATEDAVSIIQGGVVLPLVIGAGGPLFRYRDGVLVHDRRSSELLVIGGSILQPSSKGAG